MTIEMPANPGFGIGARESTKAWAKRNGCALTPSVKKLDDADPGDGTRVQRETFRNCDHGDVELVVVDGGGHTWPSGWQYKSVAEVGRTSRDVDASTVIVDFFRAH